MEEEATGQAAAPEAPPGEAEAPAPEASAAPPPIDPTQLPDFADSDATEAWIAAATAATNAQAEAGEPAAEADPPSETTAEESLPRGPSPAAEPAAAARSADAAPGEAKADEPDPASVAEYLKSKGYKIEAPAPPPDPAQQLLAEVVEFAGTDEQYAAARAAADADIPPPPSDTDPAWQQKYDERNEAISKRDAALADVRRMNTARTISAKAARIEWDRAMGRLGQAWATLPETYGLSPERAKRVTEPANATDAVAAIVEQVSATYEAKLAAQEKHWRGEVARAKGDRSAENVRRMGAAPQPAASTGGRAAMPAPAWGNTPLPDEAWIQKAIAGDLAGVDLSDR